MTKDEALKLALEALERMYIPNFTRDDSPINKAIAAIKKALAQPEQGPVGYWEGEFSDDGGATLYEVPQQSIFGRKYRNETLYASPPQRTWVGLTDEELAEFSDAKLGAYDLCLEVEAKLKEKNNG